MLKTILAVPIAIAILAGYCLAAADANEEGSELLSNLEVHGFYEMRAGYRTRKDPYEKDMSIMENRLQLDLSSYTDSAEYKLKGDFIGDLTLEEGDFDLREAWALTTPADFMDVKLGRQILTWGTGDLIFINDLFPKDWQAFFIGRDVEYLKAPSDAAKFSLFSDLANLDIVYTPQFDPDRYVTGERLSYFNPFLDRLAGRDAIIHSERPNSCFKDYELAARLYKNISNYELAVYGYHGYWKSPGGTDPVTLQATFPDLNVYGASIRGAIGKGIGNVEAGYYQSVEDESGKDPFINNSQFRFLVGYTQEIAKNFTGGLQYYLEHMMDYDEFKESGSVALAQDRNRHVLTLRLTRLLLNQNLQLSLFTYFSPSDKDAYLRPNVNYKVNDNLTVEAGANIFFGDYIDTFFGQFENNTNVYTGFRYSF